MDWIAGQQGRMLRELIEWANINTGTGNVGGTEKFLDRVLAVAGELGDGRRYFEPQPARKVDRSGKLVDFPLGRGLVLLRRPNAPRKIFLCIHSDTVYPPDSPFQKAEMQKDGTLRGPGVADAKGGLMVMLTGYDRPAIRPTLPVVMRRAGFMSWSKKVSSRIT